MCENLPKYLEDPEKYCSRINTLLEQNSTEWQDVWKAAIPELSNLAGREISVINSLLKPIETAFKSKNSELRVQAFECWSVFITQCEEGTVSDKLWNVLLVPLMAYNHSHYAVLSAKIETWSAFVSTSFTNKPQIVNKATTSILRLLYGPHTLRTAREYAALAEPSGKLYHKLMMKCSPFDEQLHNIFSYMEHAIPVLSNLETTRGIANKIWTDALKIISTNNWRMEYFYFLMHTLKKLLCDDKNEGYHLINNFLHILFNIHEAFPSYRLTPHLNLIIRCLFRSPAVVDMVNDTMNSMIRRCENPSICFVELDKELMNRISQDTKDIDILWNAIASCYTKWLRSGPSNQESTTALRILLFPVNHMSEISYEKERFNCVMKNWKICFEECAKSAESERFLQELLDMLEASIDSNIPRLIVATFICNSILAIIKISRGPIPCKSVLLKISKNMPDIKTLTGSNLQFFAIKYLVTVKALTKLDPTYSKDFSDVMKAFDLLVSKNTDEVSGSSKSVVSGDGLYKSAKEESNGDNIATPIRNRSRLTEKLSSPATKKSEIRSPARWPTTPKRSEIDDDDIQVVEIKPKSKNSPMTQHQLEKARIKRYIPPMYEDLSQSQSQSLSQREPESIFSATEKPNNTVDPNLFEENANLPSAVSSSSALPGKPPILSFSSDLNSPCGKSAPFLSRISLFNGTKALSRENSDSDSSIEVINIKKSREKDKNNLQNDCEMLDKQPAKRKLSKGGEHNAVTPTKRSKRLLNKNEINGEKLCTIEPAVVDIAKMDSENVLSSNRKSIGGVSRSSSSSMKYGDTDTKRRSLRSNRNISESTPPTRKRKPTTSESGSKKPTDSDSSYDEKKTVRDKKESKKSKPSITSTVHIVVADVHKDHQLDNVPVEFTLNQIPYGKMSGKESALVEENSSAEIPAIPNESQTRDEVTENNEKNTSKVTESLNKPSPTDSVILVEDCAAEVISIDDSESLHVARKPDESKKTENSSDESTFYEGSDQNVRGKELCELPRNDESVVRSETNVNSVSIQQPITSPEVISSMDTGSVEKNENSLDVCTNQDTVESEEIQDGFISSVSGPENCDTSAPKEFASNLLPLFTEENVNAEAALIEPPSDEAHTDQVTVVSGEISLPLDIHDKESKSNGESVDKKKKKDNADNISSIHGNSRGKHITKMAQGGNNMFYASKPAKTMPQKPEDSCPSGNSSSSPISIRIRQMVESTSIKTTPNKSITVPPEEKRKFVYTPKECISPSILKKPYGTLKIYSPKSPKVVNFADNLTHVKYFQDDEESVSDSMISTEDKPSNENLLNDAPLRSQDMLYSPLKNCRDSIESLLRLIFTSAGSTQALEYFQRININTVGELASMSTLTASSIPAGDNRIRRLRRALKKHSESMERDGRRRSVRRRILKSSGDSENREVSCLMDLFDDVELVDSGNGSDEETGASTCENEKLLPEKSTAGANDDVPKSNALVQESNDVNGSLVAQQPVDDKTENDEVTRAEINEEAVVISNDELEKPYSKPIDSAVVVIEDCVLGKRIENKENVDPTLDAPSIEIVSELGSAHSQQVERMEVDEQACELPKASNETINESADYVCTDSNTYEQNDNDRRSMTVHNIHRYSTGIESNIKETSNAVPLSTEAASTEAVIVNDSDNSTNESVSIFAENNKMTAAEETLPSVVENVIVTSSASLDHADQKNITPNEAIVGSENENFASESISIFAENDHTNKTPNDAVVVNENENSASESISIFAENDHTNKTPNDAVLVDENENSASESISIFAENEVVANGEIAIDSRSTSHSTIEEGIVTSCVSNCIANHHDNTTAPDSVQKISDRLCSMMDLMKRNYGSYSWNEVVKIVFPFHEANEEDSQELFTKMIEKFETVFSCSVEKK